MSESKNSFEALLASLNPAQRAAVEHASGPLLVLAGAGSGKTRVLTARIANLVHTHGVQPQQVMAVTFTNKAAGEMSRRVESLLGAKPAGMWLGTFHAIGARMLRTWPELSGRTRAFTIYDEDDSLSLLKRTMGALRVDEGRLPPKAVLAAISDAKNTLVSAAEYARLARDPFSTGVAGIYAAMDQELRRANAVSFDDLLTLPVEMLQGNPELLSSLQRRFQHVLVDEYQDTNHAQYRLVSLLSREHRNICVVGDDDQSIYGWRGADLRNILEFEKDFAGAATVRLEENYRSTPQVLALANRVISANEARKGKTLRATVPPGEPVTLCRTADERDEATWIVERVAELLLRSRSLRDFALLYRTNSQSRALEEALRRRGFPYRIIGSVRFFDRREIRDLMAWLRLIANPRDDEAFLRAISAPRRGIGDVSLARLGEFASSERIPLLEAASRATDAELRAAARVALEDFANLVTRLSAAAQEQSVDELLHEIVDATDFLGHLRQEGEQGEERVENVRELISSAAETSIDAGGELGLTPLELFLQHSALLASVDTLDANADALTLMTLHNAKGLEFPVVFVTGLEEGLFPIARAMEDQASLEEERRLFYVGITRAISKLYLSLARSRRRNGEMRSSIASSFIKEVPAGYWEESSTLRYRALAQEVEISSVGGYSTSRRTTWAVPARHEPVDADFSQDLPRFVRGERVRHPRFGDGTIAELTGQGRDAKATVDFDDEDIGRKKLLLVYAGLERGWAE